MPQFQLLGVTVAIGGDIRNTIVFDHFDAITYPEYLCLMIAHGEGALSNLFDTGETVERDEAAERERLKMKFGKDLVNMAFPGVAGQLPTRKDGVPVVARPSAPVQAEPTPAPVEPAPAPVGPALDGPALVQVDPASVDPAVAGGVPPVGKKQKAQ